MRNSIGPILKYFAVTMFLVTTYSALSEGSADTAHGLPLATGSEWLDAEPLARKLAVVDMVNDFDLLRGRGLLRITRFYDRFLMRAKLTDFLSDCIDESAYFRGDSVIVAIALDCIDYYGEWDVDPGLNLMTWSQGQWKSASARNRIGAALRFTKDMLQTDNRCDLRSRLPAIADFENATQVASVVLAACIDDEIARPGGNAASVERIARACWSWICNRTDRPIQYGPTFN